jgi:hypothetical protein
MGMGHSKFTRSGVRYGEGVGRWQSTAAIDIIEFAWVEGEDFAVGSVIRLWRA